MGNDDVRARRARADRALFLVWLHALLQLMFFTHVRESRPGRAQCPGAARTAGARFGAARQWSSHVGRHVSWRRHAQHTRFALPRLHVRANLTLSHSHSAPAQYLFSEEVICQLVGRQVGTRCHAECDEPACGWNEDEDPREDQ